MSFASWIFQIENCQNVDKNVWVVKGEDGHDPVTHIEVVDSMSMH